MKKWQYLLPSLTLLLCGGYYLVTHYHPNHGYQNTVYFDRAVEFVDGSNGKPIVIETWDYPQLGVERMSDSRLPGEYTLEHGNLLTTVDSTGHSTSTVLSHQVQEDQMRRFQNLQHGGFSSLSRCVLAHVLGHKSIVHYFEVSALHFETLCRASKVLHEFVWLNMKTSEILRETLVLLPDFSLTADHTRYAYLAPNSLPSDFFALPGHHHTSLWDSAMDWLHNLLTASRPSTK